jgi:hypothetical protein
MNLDQLKDDWNSAKAPSSNISPAQLKIKEAHTPIETIRKKMKGEFNYQLIGMFIIGLSPFTFDFPAKIIPVFVAFYSIMCGFTAYYFYKFYTFYKNGYDLSLDSRKNLLWFYYEMKMNVELYKALSYNLAFIGIAFVGIALLMVSGDKTPDSRQFSIPLIVVACFSSVLLMGLATELWAKYYYGKYLAQLKAIIDALDDE